MVCTDFPVSHVSDFNPSYQLGTATSPVTRLHPQMAAQAPSTLHTSVFSCSISRSRARVTIGIIGEIDRTSAGQFRNQLLSAAKAHPAAIEIDMQHVALADEAGVAVLIEAWRFALEHGIELAVKSPSPAITRTFEIAPSGQLLSLQV